MAQFKDYISALRAFAFPASALPSLTGSIAAAFFLGETSTFSFSWLHCFLALSGCLAIHAVSNLVNDYFDFRSGLDSKQNFGLKNPLVRGALTIGEMRFLIFLTFSIALFIAAYFILRCGLPLLSLILFGAASAWFYTAPPLQLKYRGGGDIQVILSFGILVTFGSYYTQAYTTEPFLSGHLWQVVALSLPQSFLINAILHANNHRDRTSDALHGARTLATRLSEQNSTRVQYLLLGAAYSTLIVLAFSISPFLLLCLFSLPAARRVAANIHRKEEPGTDAFRLLVADAARLQMQFGLWMIIALGLALFIKR